MDDRGVEIEATLVLFFTGGVNTAALFHSEDSITHCTHTHTSYLQTHISVARVCACVYLINTRLDSDHDGISKYLAIFTERFPCLQFGLILNVHPVS